MRNTLTILLFLTLAACSLSAQTALPYAVEVKNDTTFLLQGTLRLPITEADLQQQGRELDAATAALDEEAVLLRRLLEVRQQATALREQRRTLNDIINQVKKAHADLLSAKKE